MTHRSSADSVGRKPRQACHQRRSRRAPRQGMPPSLLCAETKRTARGNGLPAKRRKLKRASSAGAASPPNRRQSSARQRSSTRRPPRPTRARAPGEGPALGSGAAAPAPPAPPGSSAPRPAASDSRARSGATANSMSGGIGGGGGGSAARSCARRARCVPPRTAPPGAPAHCSGNASQHLSQQHSHENKICKALQENVQMSSPSRTCMSGWHTVKLWMQVLVRPRSQSAGQRMTNAAAQRPTCGRRGSFLRLRARAASASPAASAPAGGAAPVSAGAPRCASAAASTSGRPAGLARAAAAYCARRWRQLPPATWVPGLVHLRALALRIDIPGDHADMWRRGSPMHAARSSSTSFTEWGQHWSKHLRSHRASQSKPGSSRTPPEMGTVPGRGARQAGCPGRAATCASSASCAGRGSCRCRICSCCRSVSTYCAARARALISSQTRQLADATGEAGLSRRVGWCGANRPRSEKPWGCAACRSCRLYPNPITRVAPAGSSRAARPAARAGRRCGAAPRPPSAAARAPPPAGAHRQAALALLAARDELEQLVRLAQVAPDGLHLLHAVLVVLAPPARLRAVDLLARPARAPDRASRDSALAAPQQAAASLRLPPG